MRSSGPGRLVATLMLAIPLAAGAQAVPRQLTLPQALDLARRNSPTYRQALNDADPASAAVREATFQQLPTIGVSGGLGYTGAGRSTFGGTTFNQSSPAISSSYNIGARWSLSTRTFLAPSQARAQERATEENITGAGVTLTSDVTAQYLASLRATATVEVGRQQVARAQEFLDLARARQGIGNASLVDVRLAEVDRSRAEVSLLQARQAEAEAKIELMRLLGVPAPDNVDSLTLAEPFPLAAPSWDFAQLKQWALDGNPALRSAAASRDAAGIGVTAARLDRLPTISISTGWSGYTQQFTNDGVLLNNALGSAESIRNNCQFQNGILERLTSPHPAPNGGIIDDCNSYAGLDVTGQALQPQVVKAILDRNRVFPFSFSRQPWSIQLGIDLPIWDGYSRSLAISRARAQREDADEVLRGTRLQVEGLVQARWRGVTTAWQTVQLQDSSRVAARDQRQLAEEKYRVGSGTALEVSTAQNTVAQAEADYVNAVYAYHLAVVGLETVVGRPLR